METQYKFDTKERFNIAGLTRTFCPISPSRCTNPTLGRPWSDLARLVAVAELFSAKRTWSSRTFRVTLKVLPEPASLAQNCILQFFPAFDPPVGRIVCRSQAFLQVLYSNQTQKNQPLRDWFFFVWCPVEDLNLHDLAITRT